MNLLKTDSMYKKSNTWKPEMIAWSEQNNILFPSWAIINGAGLKARKEIMTEYNVYYRSMDKLEH